MHIFLKFLQTYILCTMFTAVAVYAQNPSGIHVEAGTRRVVVFLDGTQMSIPTNSCFIANLRNGRYLLQVYDASQIPPGYSRPGSRPLHRQTVDMREGHIVEINVGNLLEPDDGEWGEGGSYPSYDSRGVMSPAMFSQFLATYKNAKWDSDRKDMIETAVLTSRFTCQQCMSILQLMKFDDDKFEFIKRIYPAIADKENTFLFFNEFKFGLSKEKLRDFLKRQYGNESVN